MHNINIGITPIFKIRKNMWLSRLVSNEAALWWDDRQVSLLLAVVTAGWHELRPTATRGLLPKARSVMTMARSVGTIIRMASSDCMQSVRLLTSSRRMTTSIRITPSIINRVAARSNEANLWWSDKQLSLFLAVGTTDWVALSRTAVARVQLYKPLDSLNRIMRRAISTAGRY